MKQNNSKNRSGLFRLILSALVVSSGLWSCFPDYKLDKEFPEWLGTSIYETLQDGFDGDNGKHYTFNYFIRLIDTLDQKSILSRTGSRTLFVADDVAFQAFLDKCPIAGGASVKFSDLSRAQLKMILKGSMLNNVFQVASLSNTSTDNGVRLGDCMRRVSTMSEYDTVRILKPEDMPNTQYWSYLKNNPNRATKGIVILEDGTRKPMIFFAPEFLSSRKITDGDYNFLFNLGEFSKSNKPGRNSRDASVNGVKIEFQNKKCYNGFIHVMESVVYLLPSMAEYLAQRDENGNSNSIIYSSILERFSAPFFPTNRQAVDTDHSGSGNSKKVRDLLDDDYYGPEGSKIDEALKAGGKDSVFTKMYFSGRYQGAGQDRDTLATDPKGGAYQKSAVLKFDPGWNSYFMSSSAEDDVALQEDMSVMFVPTDSALMRWWVTQADGVEMRKKYGTKTNGDNLANWTAQDVAEDMSGIDLNVIVKLINNCMFNSFTSTVPSKFPYLLNDAQDPFFENPATALDQYFKPKYIENPVVMCCNGAIYFSDKVFVPTAYKAVSYPALINDKLKILNWAIEDQEMSFSYYLNSMQSGYSLFLPEVNFTDVNETYQERLIWVDPASFAMNKYDPKSTGKDSLYALAFYYDETAKTVKADYYDYDASTGTVGTNKLNSTSISNETFIRNRLEDFMDYHIILLNDKNFDALESGEFEDATEHFAYFRTKGGGAIRFSKGSFVRDKNSATQDHSTSQVAGGFQIETGDQIGFVNSFDMSANDGNGITYIVDRPLQTSRMSVYDILSDSTNYPRFSSFFNLMKYAEDSIGKKIFDDRYGDLDIGSKQCVTSFNTYNYTIYVPDSSSINQLLRDTVIIDPLKLLAWDSIYGHICDSFMAESNQQAKWKQTIKNFFATNMKMTIADSDPLLVYKEDYDSTAFKMRFINVKKQELVNFIKYHIQDNSVYANAEFNRGEADYETAYLNKSKQFGKLTVNVGDGITITDAKNNVRNVLKQKKGTVPYWNIMTREYVFKKYSSDYSSTSSDQVSDIQSAKLETSSYAVIHLIDGALCNGELNF
jgi:hypothetical protein